MLRVLRVLILITLPIFLLYDTIRILIDILSLALCIPVCMTRKRNRDG